MSRTYKDRPHWVQSNEQKSHNPGTDYHDCGARWVVLKYKEVEVVRRAYYWEGVMLVEERRYMRKIPTQWGSEYRECTIDEPRVNNIWQNNLGKSNCRHRDSVRHKCEIQKNDRKGFHRSVRTERKNITKRLVDEYNTSGTIEDNYVFTPHRKNATFGGGYFD